jgi:sigma-B regulation protein RsbU (phosphoserine phosphatase)
MLLNLTEYSTKTIQNQIFDQIIEKVISGELLPGQEIEAIGQLARQQHVSKNTIKKVYRKLEDKSILEFKNEVGFFIKEISEEQIQQFKVEKERSSLKSISDYSLQNILNEAAEKHKLEEELKLARKIQADLLPKSPIIHRDLSIHGFIQPSRVVCGDFYDYFKIDEDKYGLIIADASGKGMPAAILISQIQAIIKSELGNGSTIEKIAGKLNSHLIKNCSASSFTSLFYGVADLSTREFRYVNAGHNFPVILKENLSFELLKTTGPALGLVPDFKYSTQITELPSESIILFYTDGLTETMNEHGEQFGEGRLIELLIKNRESESEELIENIINDLEVFKSEKYVNDDKTILLVKYTP